MRSLAASLLMFALVIGAVIANGIYVTRISDEISELASEIADAAPDGALSPTDELVHFWEKHKLFLELGLGSSGIERLNELVISLRFAVSDGDHREIARICALIREQCADVSLHERLSLHGII